MPANERWARGAGIALIGAGLLTNEWVVAWIATSDGTIDDPVVRGVLWVVSLAAVAGGIAAFRTRRLPRWRTAARGLATAAIAVVTLELGLHALDWMRRPEEAPRDPRSRLSPYAGSDWAPELFEELGPVRGTENNFVFDPALGWKLAPYDGRYVHVDERGVRRTWNPPDLPDDAPTVWVFGGSAVWGTGARDDYTLPSQLSRALARRGRPHDVTNYGQLAYTFPRDQDLIQLILLLRDGHRPDVAVFYHGANDLYGAYYNGEPGGTLPWRALSSRVETPLALLKTAAVKFLDRHSRLYAGLRALAAPPARFSEVGARMSDDELRALAGRFADEYEKTSRLVAALARAYGFGYVTLWQPVTFTEQQLLDEERSDPRTGDEALGKLHRLALDELRGRDLEHFHDLSDVLRGRTQTYYLDYRHLSEQGNAVVAERIADLMLREGAEGAADGSERR